MRRREILAGLAAATLSAPFARAQQQGERQRRVAVLMTLGEDDAQGQRRVKAFVQAMEGLGWV